MFHPILRRPQPLDVGKHRRSRRRTALLAVGAVALVAGACSSAAANNTPAGTSESSSGNQPSARPTPPAASGSIASISGTSMEVQNQQTGQETVEWTSSTTFSHTVSASLSTVAVGDCVSAIGTPSGSSVAANQVTISQPDSSGTCQAGGGGLGFGGGSASGGPPSGFTPPNGGTFPGGGSQPSGGNFANFGSASGKVTAVSGSGFTVEGVLRSAANRSSSPKTTSITVSTSSSTNYSQTASTDSSSLAVGLCVTAQGSADQQGNITATSISIRNPDSSGSCGFGFRPGGASGASGSSNA